MSLVMMRRMTDRRIKRAVQRCRALTQEQAFAALCSKFPAPELSRSQWYGIEQRRLAIAKRQLARTLRKQEQAQ